MKIIRDTREKFDYFTFSTYKDVEVVKRCLKTGDYSIEGFEDRITIDRKRNTGELYLNLGAGLKRVTKEIERMKDFERALFVCSFPESDMLIFPNRSGIPQKEWGYLKMKAAALRKGIYVLKEKFPYVEFIFCEDHYEAEKVTYNILKEFYDKHNQ